MSLPLKPQAFEKEKEFIKHLAQVNGRKNFSVEGIIRMKTIRRSLDPCTSLPRTTTKKKRRWIRMLYLGNISNSIGSLLKQYNLMPAFYSINTSSIKDPIPRSKRSGVYVLPCNDCDAVYVGETSRQFQVRLHEHLDSRPHDSAFGKHLIEEKRSYR